MILNYLDFGYDVKSRAFKNFAYSFSTTKEDNDAIRAVKDAKNVMTILERLLEENYASVGFVKEPKGEIGGRSSTIGVGYSTPPTFNPISRMKRGQVMTSLEYKLPHNDTGNVEDIGIWFYCSDDREPRLLSVHESTIAIPGIILGDRVKNDLRRIEDLRRNGVNVEKILTPMLAAGK